MRDMDLVREIMIEMESRGLDGEGQHLKIHGYTEEQVGFHLLLLSEAGYMLAIDGGTMGNRYRGIIPIRLTWEGYEFLALMKNQTAWQKAKATFSREGLPLAVGVLRALLEGFAKDQLGIK